MASPSTEYRPSGHWPNIEILLDRFETAWQNGPAPTIEDFLNLPTGDPDRRRLLIELIKVDLEYVWSKSQSSQTECPVLEDYGSRFHELGRADSYPLELIAAEYRVRCWAGRPPAVDEYTRRFGARQG